MSLASLQVLTRRLGVADSNAAAADALNRASARFVGEVGFNPGHVAADPVELDGNSSSVLLLPHWPIGAVASVTLNGQPITDWTLSRRLGMLSRIAGWPWGFGNIVATYDHGWADEALPADISDAVLEQAEAIYRLRPGVRQTALGPQSVTFDPGISQTWANTVARYRRGGTLAA